MSPNGRAGVTLGLAIGSAIAIVLLVRTGAGLLPPPAGAMGAVAFEAVATILLYGALAGIAFAAIMRERRLAGLMGPRIAPAIGLGAAIGVGGLLVTYLYAVIAGLAMKGSGVAAPGLLLIGTLVVIGQSAAEELFFRGWLQRSLAAAWGPWPAIAAAAAVFAGLHLLGGQRVPLALVNLFLGGLLFGLLAERSGGLALPIAAHAGWNWTEQLLLGLDPNPGIGPYTALIDRDLVGSAAWGGSAEGLNASLAVSFVLVALLIPSAMWGGAGAVLRRRPA